MDFYEDELIRFNYDWKEVVAEYLFSGDEPVFNAVIADCQFFTRKTPPFSAMEYMLTFFYSGTSAHSSRLCI